MVVQEHTSGRRSSEKVGRRGGEDWGGDPRKNFGNMGENMCNFGAFVGKIRI